LRGSEGEATRAGCGPSSAGLLSGGLLSPALRRPVLDSVVAAECGSKLPPRLKPLILKRALIAALKALRHPKPGPSLSGT